MTAEVLRLNANMGDIHVTREPAILTALGLGSCIGLTVMCPRTRVAGMIHIMLPAAFAGRPMDKVGKYADTGIVELMDQMRAAGAGPSLVWAYAGGAQVFQLGKGQGLEIGRRNAEAVAQHLADMRAKILAKDVGGSTGRTLNLDTRTGEVTVKTPAGALTHLCRLAA